MRNEITEDNYMDSILCVLKDSICGLYEAESGLCALCMQMSDSGIITQLKISECCNRNKSCRSSALGAKLRARADLIRYSHYRVEISKSSAPRPYSPASVRLLVAVVSINFKR